MTYNSNDGKGTNQVTILLMKYINSKRIVTVLFFSLHFLTFKFLKLFSMMGHNKLGQSAIERIEKRMNFQTIGYNGKNVGTISFQSDKLVWKDNRGHSMEISSSSIKEISWIIVGNKADLNLSANGVHHKFDGFSKSDFENIRSFAKDKWILELRIQEVCFLTFSVLFLQSNNLYHFISLFIRLEHLELITVK